MLMLSAHCLLPPDGLCRWFLSMVSVGYQAPRTHRIPPGADGRPVPVGWTTVQKVYKYVEDHPEDVRNASPKVSNFREKREGGKHGCDARTRCFLLSSNGKRHFRNRGLKVRGAGGPALLAVYRVP